MERDADGCKESQRDSTQLLESAEGQRKDKESLFSEIVLCGSGHGDAENVVSSFLLRKMTASDGAWGLMVV